MMRFMRYTILTLAVVAITSWSSVRASDDLAGEMKKDVVLRAMVDELERSREKLLIEDLARPYFIEYAMSDTASAGVSADLGAVADEGEVRNRRLRVDARVGSYELDNTNFADRFGGFGRFGGFSPIAIEDDYTAIRQAIWWMTDRDYKGVVESLERKRAFMESVVIEDNPDDFSREKAVVSFEERSEVDVDLAALRSLATTLSAVFREFGQIKNSNVNVSMTAGNNYLVNTEGTRIRQAGSLVTVSVTASIQAEDGMELSDSVTIHRRTLKDLPSVSEMTDQCRELCDRLVKLGKAPLLESYTGPVLFEAAAAGNVFRRSFARRFAGGQRPVGSRSDPNDFESRIGKRILPRFLDVVDDPTLETIHGEQVMGQYDYDDQGVKASRVELVKGGRLKKLVLSRNPSKSSGKSTGHGRGAFAPRASSACLIVSAENTSSAAELRDELLETASDEGLDFALRIASLGSVSNPGGGRFRGGGSTVPLEMYKVYVDGREELVRGAEIARIDLKAFKRILAVGDKPYVLNTRGNGGTTIVAPAMLFDELDLAKIDRDFDRPPILENPVARTQVD